jgi:heterodisulfide reductase subunit C
MSTPIEVGSRALRDDLLSKIPDGNLNMCLTCGACTGGCPATGQFDLDPRKFIRMIALGMDEEVLKSDWIWACTMCARCSYVCPMEINFHKIIFNMRSRVPRDERPLGIRKSCDNHIKTGNAMGVSNEDFMFTVEDVVEEVREDQPEFKDMKATINRKGAYYLLNQNSREPVTEPDEMVPLLKILHKVGADWTYPSIMWGGENYCLFLADDEGWKYIMETFTKHIDENIGCKEVINTE